MFGFDAESKELKFTKEQNEEQREHDSKLETFKANAQEDQIANNQMNERSDLIMWQQNLDPELNKLINTLKGNVLINNEWTPRTYWKEGKLQKVRPMCNDRFVAEVIIPQCTPYMDRNIINTWYSEKQILDSLKNTCFDIKDAMCDNYDCYGIEFTNYDLVLRNIISVIKPGAFRALEGWTTKINATMIKRIEQSNDQQKEKKGLFDAFKPTKY